MWMELRMVLHIDGTGFGGTGSSCLVWCCIHLFVGPASARWELPSLLTDLSVWTERRGRRRTCSSMTRQTASRRRGSCSGPPSVTGRQSPRLTYSYLRVLLGSSHSIFSTTLQDSMALLGSSLSICSTTETQSPTFHTAVCGCNDTRSRYSQRISNCRCLSFYSLLRIQITHSNMQPLASNGRYGMV